VSKPNRPPEEGQSVPCWIVSFSDMVTLLLAFFVLLQTFAHVQDPELFFAGQGSFRRAVSGGGLSTMFRGQLESPRRDWRSKKYPSRDRTRKPSIDRVIDDNDEQIRQAFKKMKDQLDLQASSLNEKIVQIYSTPIVFEPGRDDLDDNATRYLQRLAIDLRTIGRDATRLYVVGLAADEEKGKSGWLCSARRAEVVHQALERLLAAQGRAWEIRSWGAAQSGQWCRKHGIEVYGGAGRTGTHVAIVVARVVGGV